MARINEIVLGPRSTLTKGDKFRVTDGPFWTSSNGETYSMRAKGIMTFNYAFAHKDCIYIDAESDRDGHVTLHIKGERVNKNMPELTCRPYRIVGRVTGRRRRRQPVKG